MKTEKELKPWTAEDLGYLGRNYGKVSLDELAEALGRTAAAVSQKAGTMGLKTPRRKPPEPTTLRINVRAFRTISPDPVAASEWRGKLGWVFSAEDCAYEERMRREAEEWFAKTYGRRHRRDRTPQNPEGVPTVVSRREAADWIGIRQEGLAYGMKLGVLPYHREPGEAGVFFRTEHLEIFRRELEKAGLWGKWAKA